MDIKCKSLISVPKYSGLKNEITLTIKEGKTWEGDRYGDWIGRKYYDGTIKSAFYKDRDNNNSEIFDKLFKDIGDQLIEKNITVMRNDELFNATDYYIPYKVIDHCSGLPTIKNTYVDNCNNVKYNVTYEVLFVADENYTRYLTFDYKTEGTYATSFFQKIDDIEDDLEIMFEEQENDFRINDNYNCKEVAFYNDIGEKTFIEINSISELLSMIASIRIINLERKIIE